MDKDQVQDDILQASSLIMDFYSLKLLDFLPFIVLLDIITDVGEATVNGKVLLWFTIFVLDRNCNFTLITLFLLNHWVVK